MLTATRAVQPENDSQRLRPPGEHEEIRLLVVDDHAAVRLGVVQLLEGQRDFSVQAVSSSAESAVSEAELTHVDVAVVDYDLGSRNGLWACRRLKGLADPPRVIIYSAFANDHLAICALVAGADGILNKGGLGSELCDAVREIAHGRRVLPRPTQPVADMLRRRLDETEQPIFGMLLAGMSRPEILETSGMTARELSSREGVMLGKLEVLPGEINSRGRPGKLDMERLIPQAAGR